jgi:hypothetical protein
MKPKTACTHVWTQFIRPIPGGEARRVCKACQADLGAVPHEDAIRLNFLIKTLCDKVDQLTHIEHQWLHGIRYREALTYDEHMKIREIMERIENGQKQPSERQKR